MAAEELTKELFGDYVSIYNFQQSIEAVLDDKLPSAYDVDWYEQKCDGSTTTSMKSTMGAGQSVYGKAGMR